MKQYIRLTVSFALFLVSVKLRALTTLYFSAGGSVNYANTGVFVGTLSITQSSTTVTSTANAFGGGSSVGLSAGDLIYAKIGGTTWTKIGTWGSPINNSSFSLASAWTGSTASGLLWCAISKAGSPIIIKNTTSVTFDIDMGNSDSMVINTLTVGDAGGTGGAAGAGTFIVNNVNSIVHIKSIATSASPNTGTITLTNGTIRLWGAFNNAVMNPAPTGITWNLSTTAGTIEYLGSVIAQNIVSTTYFNLKLNGNTITTYGTKTALGNITVNGTLTVSAGTLAMGANTLTLGASSTLTNAGTISTTATTGWVTDNRTSNQYIYNGTISFGGASTTIPATNRQFTNLNINAATTLSDSIRVTGTLTIANAVKLNLAGKKLTVGAFASTGQITASNAAEILYTGTTNSTMYMDQATPGTTNTLKSLTMFGPASLLTLGNILQLYGGTNGSLGELVLGTSSSSVLTSNTSFGTGAAPVTPLLQMLYASGNHAVMNLRGGLIVGEVLIQDLLASGYRAYRQFGFAVDSAAGVSMNQITDDIDVYAIVQNGSTYSNPGTSSNPNGYKEADNSTTKNSAYLYQESNNPRWVPFTFINSTTQSVPKGRGLMVFLRPFGTTSAGSYAEQIVDVEGSVNCAADVAVTSYVDGSLSASNNGWNLIANPYQSYLDYSSFATDNVSNLVGGASQSIKKYDKTIRNYTDALKNSGGTNWTNSNNTTVLPCLDPGDAFFVRAKNNSGTLTFKRSQTTPVKEASIDRNNKFEIDTRSYTALNVKLFTSMDTTLGDVMNIWFSDWGKDNTLSNFDILNLSGNCLDVSTLTLDGESCSMKNMSNLNNSLVPLKFSACATGDYSFYFDKLMNNSREGEVLKLFDNYLGIEKVIKTVDKYIFSVDENEKSKAGDRFFLKYVSENLNTQILEDDLITIYPNPLVKGIPIRLLYANCEIISYEVLNLAGQKVLDSDRRNLKRIVEVETAGLEDEMYFLKLETTKGTVVKKFLFNN